LKTLLNQSWNADVEGLLAIVGTTDKRQQRETPMFRHVDIYLGARKCAGGRSDILSLVLRDPRLEM
jgi:hypothetical protein